MASIDEIELLRRKLRAARQRARYWSGNPSSRGFGFNPSHSSTADSDIEYEAAMDDCSALADQILQITGKRPATPDPKQDFNNLFASTLLPKLAGNDHCGE